MRKRFQKLPKCLRVLLWVLGILLGLVLITMIVLKIRVLTWPEYKGNGFDFRYPLGWDIQDPRKDTSDTQFVYDSGSILKIGDQQTNFLKDTDGVYRYHGNTLIYVYRYPKTESDLSEVIGSVSNSKNFFVARLDYALHGKNVVLLSYRNDNYYTDDYYFDGSNQYVYKIEVSVYGSSNKLKNIYYMMLGRIIANTIEFSK